MASETPAQFYRSIIKSQKNPRRLVRERTRKIMFTLYGSIAQRTPVDTGRAQGGWTVTIDRETPSFEDPGKEFEGSSAALNNVQRSKIKFVRAFTDNWIANNVPYIVPLENGHSERAANGMVAVSISGIRERFNL